MNMSVACLGKNIFTKIYHINTLYLSPRTACILGLKMLAVLQIMWRRKIEWLLKTEKNLKDLVVA
jgi:hypothetical protein